jgi:hypothetical protein
MHVFLLINYSHGPMSACRMPEGIQTVCIRTDCSLCLLVAIAYSTRSPQHQTTDHLTLERGVTVAINSSLGILSEHG